jgi:benzoyl-CoA reductase subunit D
MIVVGIDSGSQNTKGVLFKDGEIVSRMKVMTEFDAEESSKVVYEGLLKENNLKNEDVDTVVSTGTSRELVQQAQLNINEVISAAKGVKFKNTEADLIIDMGAETCRVIQLDENGNVKKYGLNDKCASGAGTFIEAMARALQIRTEDMGGYSLRHTKELVTNSQCVVFAESEVISLIHSQETVEDIAYGIHMGIASRVASLVRRIGEPNKISVIGGPGYNAGLVQCMGKVVDKEISALEDAEYISAIGAAVYGIEKVTA